MTPATILPLSLAYKGARPYIQGGDMLAHGVNALIAHFNQPLEQLDFSIHRMTGQQLHVHVFQTDHLLPTGEDDIALLRFNLAGTPWQAKWVAQPAHPSNRFPFNEQETTQHCHLNTAEKSILLAGEPPFTLIETTISMTKYLHQHILPVNNAQWIFCRWTSAQWPTPAQLSGLKVTLTKALGTKLTSSSVTQHDVPLCTIYFSTKAST